MTRDLKRAADLLSQAENALPKNMAEKPQDCDDWCKFWMLLVGTWYSLHYAAPYLQPERLGGVLTQAHEFCVQQLRATYPSAIPGTTGPHPWFAGYFLVSGEHRLANTLDRATKLAVHPHKLAKAGVRVRREELSRCCPKCRSYRYSPEVGRILGSESSRMVVVYERVNTIKHDGVETAVDAVSTEERWNDAFDALLEAATVVPALAAHKQSCGVI